MTVFIHIILMFALSLGAGNISESVRLPSSMVLFDFDGDDVKSWQVVNDGVMGGRSKGFVSIEDGALRFTGTLVTKGGGFTSVRSAMPVDLRIYDGLEIRVRGGGRTFEVEVDDDSRRSRRSVSRRAPFSTSAEWTLVRVPFASLRSSVFGRPVNVPPIDLANVARIGFYIVDGKDGPFRLEVDEIRAYRYEGE
jgi:hypothetical protein